MFYTYLKIAVRNLVKNKSQSAILIGGLTIGIAACVLLLQYVNFELSFDNFHSKKDSIYRVVNERFQNGTSIQKGTISYPTIGPAMKEEYPEVKNATRLAYSFDVIIKNEDKIERIEPVIWTDKHFFEIFDFKLLSSDDLNVLDAPNEVVLSASTANKFFPAAKGDYKQILGKELMIDSYPNAFQIVGISEDVPHHSSLQFDILLSYDSCIRYWGEGADNSWTWSDFYHFIEVSPQTDIATLEGKFTAFSQRHFRGTEVTGSQEVFTLQPLTKTHLYSGDLEYEIVQTSNGQAIWSLLIIAFFILLLAWVNYINLSSVRAIERAKEAGVRKVVGASRWQLMGQFLTEAALVNILSFGLAIDLIWLLYPWISNSFDLAPSALHFFSEAGTNGYLLIGLSSLIFMGIIVSGAYPAWLLSSPQVANVLKGVFAKTSGGSRLRKGLVVFQFTISIALIAITWIVAKQLKFMNQQDLGIDIQQVLTIDPPELSTWDSTFIDRMNAFKATLEKYPGVVSAATSNRIPGEAMGRSFDIRKQGDADAISYMSNHMNVDFEYAKTYQLTPLAGRFFRKEDHSPIYDEVDKIVLNQAAANMFGYTNVKDALQQKLKIGDKVWQIIGILPNFHQQSMHHAIEPILFRPFYSTDHGLSVRLSGDNFEQTIAQIQSSYQQFFPDNIFQYAFVDEHFQRLYEEDIRFSKVLSFFTFLTILIACLGLFGLASYTTFLRAKEISIRKVLGASFSSIVTLLTKDFIKLIAFALMISIPIAWYVIHLWLQDFAYTTTIDWWIFACTGLLTIGLALLTIGGHSIRAALANPSQSLKNE